MIGPGTGVTPFRAFLQQRQAAGVRARWLFFGERNFTHDFLYQLEWQEWLKDGLLTPSRRRVLARSAREDLRPAPHVAAPRRAVRLAGGRRVLLRVRGRQGDGQGRPRHARAIVADRSGRSPEAAEAYLADLKKQRRYQRVY